MLDPRLSAPVAAPPSDEESAHQVVTAVAGSVGATDLFLFRRVADDRFVHVGGVGRGKGWAGNIELILADEPVAAGVYATGTIVRVEAADPTHVFGPYYACAAALVPVSHDVIAVFGNGQSPLPLRTDDELAAAAAAAAEAIDHVSPAKRLADELEILHAIKAMMSVDAEGLGEALRHIVACAASSLSCEVGLIYAPEGERLAVAELGWTIRADHHEIAAAARQLWAAACDGAVCVQDATERPLPQALAGDGGVRSYYVVPIGEPAQALLILMHTAADPRGFTALCRELGLRLAESAESVIRTAVLRQQLQDEIDRVSRDARSDPLTGLGNRLAWEEALALEEQNVADGHVAGVMVIDLNNLKGANDSKGHGIGDHLLRALGEVIRSQVREEDFVARIGGDEFAVLLPDTDYGTCATMAQRLDAELARHPVVEGFTLSAAVGFATCPPAQSLAQAQQLADALMYQRKAGRSV